MSKSLKILLVTLAWPTKNSSNLYKDLMEEFVNHGHHVDVITTNEKRFGKETIIEKDNKIRICRVACGNITKTKYFEKTISLFFLNFQLYNAYKNHYNNELYDIIIQSTPSVLISHFNHYIKNRNNSFFYLLLRDIWPQGAVDHSIIKKNSIVWKYIRFHEKKTYKLANMIGCMSNDAVEFISQNNMFLQKSNIEYCPNTIKTRTLPSIDPILIRKKYNINDNCLVFIYGGNISKSHNIKYISDCINRVDINSNVIFVFVGSGTEFESLKELTISKNNALFISHLSQNEYLDLLFSCDFGLLLLSEKYTVPQFPSKFLDYLAYEKPILSISNMNSPVAKEISNNDIGVNIENDNYEDFVTSLKKFKDKSKVIEMKQNCRTLFKKKYTTITSYKIIKNSYDRYKREN